MSEAPANWQAALTDFDRAKTELEQAYAPVPDAALSYLPDGDDLALGRLITHVANVLEHYARILAEIGATSFGQFQAAEGSGETPEMQEENKRGFGGSERARHWQRLENVHTEFRVRVESLGEENFERCAHVLSGAGAEPTPMSPATITGWMTGHYREHVDQMAQMLERWRAEQQQKAEPGP